MTDSVELRSPSIREPARNPSPARNYDGGDGGESNAPSRELITNTSTSLVDILISPRGPLSTNFPGANP
jgi:hypothetical protein